MVFVRYGSRSEGVGGDTAKRQRRGRALQESNEARRQTSRTQIAELSGRTFTSCDFSVQNFFNTAFKINNQLKKTHIPKSR